MSSLGLGPHSLAPAELDRLEDALEGLDLDGALDELEGDDPVAQRLSEYREVLLLCREAMPLEEVPAGLLDGVLAEARTAATATPAAAAAAPSFWARWRLGVWVPTLAFAGSAALLLLVLVPKRSDEPSASEAAVAKTDAAPSRADAKRDAVPDGRLAFAEPEPERLEGEDAIRGGGVAIGERAPEPAPPAAVAVDEEQAEAPANEAPADARRKAAGDMPKPKPKAPSTGKSAPSADPWSGGSAAGGAKPSAKDDDAAKEQKADDNGLAAELARADADRRGGNCGLAKMRYDKLRKADATVRARALAGLGLCATANGDTSTAKKLFEQARASDPGVSDFIDRELARLEDARANASDPSPSTKD